MCTPQTSPRSGLPILTIPMLVLAYVLPSLSECAVADRTTAELKVNRIQRAVGPAEVSDIGGFVGARFEANMEGYLRPFDIDRYVRMVEERKQREWKWVGEHPGKWLETAALAAAQSGDKALREKAGAILARLAAAQEPSGYLGVTDPQLRTDALPLRGMDAYELYFMLHGLLTVHELWREDKALDAARRLGDYFVENIGPGKAEFWPRPKGETLAGHSVHYSLEGTLLADPMLRLYLATGDVKYLNWSRWVIDNIDRWSGHNTFSNLDRVASGALGVHQIQPRVHAHTLHMNLLAFLRLYQITGDESLLRKVRGAWRDVAGRQTHVTGGVSHDEYYGPGRGLPIAGSAVETCAMMSWIEMSQYLLELTADPIYADAIERVLWNHLFAAQTVDGESFRYFTPLNGAKPAGYWHGPDCCTASGPRMTAKVPMLIYASGRNDLYVNQYIASTAHIALDSKNTVSLTQVTDYPSDEKIVLTLAPNNPVTFTLHIRLPAWCPHPSLSVNGAAVERLQPGTYAKVAREWKTGDRVTVSLPMQVQWTAGAHTTDGMWALVRGPVVYALDTVLWNKQALTALGEVPEDLANAIGLVMVEANRTPALAAASVPIGALGPAYRVTVAFQNGQRQAVSAWPFANVGRWYVDAAQKPDRNERRYAFAVWLRGAADRARAPQR